MSKIPINAIIKRLGDFAENSKAGCDGHYKHLVADLGAKVFEDDDLSKAQIEYLFNLHAFDITKGLASQPLACGVMTMYFYGKLQQRPILWLKHIDGMTVFDYVMHHNNNACSFNDVWTNKTRYIAIKNQINHILDVLQNHGYECVDHCDNYTNFMIDKNLEVYAIDFSSEQVRSLSIMEDIYSQYKSKLACTFPNQYLNQLKELSLK